MTDTKLRSTWANVNKGIAVLLLAIPILMIMSILYIGLPEHDWYDWTNPELAEYYWQLGRLELTFLLVFAITQIGYIGKYNNSV